MLLLEAEGLLKADSAVHRQSRVQQAYYAPGGAKPRADRLCRLAREVARELGPWLLVSCAAGTDGSCDRSTVRLASLGYSTRLAKQGCGLDSAQVGRWPVKQMQSRDGST